MYIYIFLSFQLYSYVAAVWDNSCVTIQQCRTYLDFILNWLIMCWIKEQSIKAVMRVILATLNTVTVKLKNLDRKYAILNWPYVSSHRQVQPEQNQLLVPIISETMLGTHLAVSMELFRTHGSS